MHALEKFRQYPIFGRFTIKMDHNSLRFFLNQKDLNDRQQKWVSKLQAYNFDIEFMKGKNNVVADALSRRPHLGSLTAVSSEWKTSIIVEYAKDIFSSSVLEGKVQDKNYRVIDELILYKNRIYLTPGSKVKATILKDYHDNPLVGHQDFYKTYKKVREIFSWKGLKRNVLKQTRECMVCQKNKGEHVFLVGLLQPLPTPN